MKKPVAIFLLFLMSGVFANGTDDDSRNSGILFIGKGTVVSNLEQISAKEIIEPHKGKTTYRKKKNRPANKKLEQKPVKPKKEKTAYTGHLNSDSPTPLLFNSTSEIFVIIQNNVRKDSKNQNLKDSIPTLNYFGFSHIKRKVDVGNQYRGFHLSVNTDENKIFTRPPPSVSLLNKMHVLT